LFIDKRAVTKTIEQIGGKIVRFYRMENNINEKSFGKRKAKKTKKWA